MDKRPIGVFDSGLGGLTVVKQIKKVLPNESIIYLGDTARVPYGTRSKKTIIKFSLQDAFYLAGKGVKCVVIACNTSSANASNHIKREIEIPVLDVVSPGIEIASKTSLKKKIGVIGTKATIRSGAYRKGLSNRGIVKVYELECPLFVPFIEEGETSGKLITLLAKKYLNSLTRRNIDTLILGCTHYPIIESVIGNVVGKNIQIINPGKALAEKLKNLLTERELLSDNNVVKHKYFLTDYSGEFLNVANMFLGEDISGNIINIDLE